MTSYVYKIRIIKSEYTLSANVLSSSLGWRNEELADNRP